MIGDLARRPAHRRRGSGRALLLARMRRIHSEGFSAVGLAVDTDNPNKALRLYESVGFTVKSRSTVFRKELLLSGTTNLVSWRNQVGRSASRISRHWK